MLFKKNKPAPQLPNRRLVPRKRLHARAASSRDEIEEYESEAEPSMKLSQAFIVVLVLHVVAVAGIYGFNKLKESSAKPIAAKKESAPVIAEKAPEPMAEAKPAASVVKPVEATAQTYTVVAGDTLKKIASKFKTSIEALEKANNLSSTSIIRTGQVLVVGKVSATPSANSAPVPASQATPSIVAKPAPVQPVVAKTAPEAPPAPAPAAPATDKSSAGGQSYVVAKGDNPYSIAKKFKVTQEALMKANNIDDPRKLKIGQKLAIP
ncbi:MAG: LysM peptidoglycan-binding domain-containing protein [Terrimicrobiaceae bacterium]